MTKTDYCIILTSCNNEKTRDNIINKLLIEKKLSACIKSKEVQSHYIWQNKLQNCKEYLLTIKSKKGLFKKIEEQIIEIHDYQIPEIIMIPIEDGNKDYLNWLEAEIGHNTISINK